MCQYCSYMPVLYNIGQYCTTYASIVRSFQSGMPAAAAATSVLAASMLPVPLAVLLRCAFVTTIYLSSTPAAPPPVGMAAPLRGGRCTAPNRGASKGASIRFVVLGIVEQCTTS